MPTLLLVVEIIGTIAFAWSGAMVAIQKKMDIFGIAILALTTAVGGGVVRDVVLGIHPPAMFHNPIYALVAIFTAMVACLPALRRLLNRKQKVSDFLMLLMDAIGLGAFTVVGVQTAIQTGHGDNLFLLIFVGTVTGVGGGVMRDVFSCSMPYIFVKHFYATASIIGAITSGLLWNIVGGTLSMMIGAGAVIVLRLLAARFHWSLPRPQE